MTVEKLGQKIQNLRRKRRLTMQALADEIGSSKSYIWDLENKPYCRPSAEMVFKLAEALQTSADFLMDDTVERERELDTDQAFFKSYLELDENGKRFIFKLMNIYKKIYCESPGA